MFYQNIGAYDEAILAYNRALTVNPQHKISLHNIAVLNVFTKQYQTAVETFSKAIAIDDMYLEAYFGRAYTFELLGEIENSESNPTTERKTGDSTDG